MHSQIKDPNLLSILERLKPFGFFFQGYDENGIPHVVGNNGQIVEINVAISYVNEILRKKKEAEENSGSIENMPDMVVAQNKESLDQENTLETSIESKQENIEVKKEEKNDAVNTSPTDVPQMAPKIALPTPKPITPYGEGFKPKTFDPSSISSVKNFVSSNITVRSNNKAKKWLAVLFKKFLDENKIK